MYLSFFPATLLQSLNQVNTKFTEVRQEQLLQTLIVLAKNPHFSLILDCKSQQNRNEICSGQTSSRDGRGNRSTSEVRRQ